MEESSPIINHGSMLDGVFGPPASKPEAIGPEPGYAECRHFEEHYEVKRFIVFSSLCSKSKQKKYSDAQNDHGI